MVETVIQRRLYMGFLLIAGLVGLSLPVAAQVTNGPLLASMAGDGKGISLNWQSSGTDQVFTVQYQETLQDGIWRIPVSSLYPVDTNWWTEPRGTNNARFYRTLAVTPARRGNLLSQTNSQNFSASLLALLFASRGISITAKYDVQGYTIVYETIDASGGRTLASGALLLPVNASEPLPLVSYQHGTITKTNEAPSAISILGEAAIGAAFATAGYAAAVPDYLGLGYSPGLHPYHQARSEATACVDMLRAVKLFCATNRIVLTNQLFLCGYSQGGHATMALLRELESFHASEFPVTACACMAGAYDLSGVTTADYLSGRTPPNPYYFLYLLASYQQVYHFAASLADLLASPYDVSLPPLLNGNSSSSQMNTAMPADPTQILKPEYLQAFKADPRHPLRLALQDNDLFRWRPISPLRLYHCSGDQDVPPANSAVALESFHALGASQVEFIDPKPSASHSDCAQPALESAKAWFDSLR